MAGGCYRFFSDLYFARPPSSDGQFIYKLSRTCTLQATASGYCRFPQTYDFANERESPGEIKRREVSWTLTKKLVQRRSRARRWCWARGELDFFCLRLFPNGGATDIVFVALFCIAVGPAIAWCGGRCAMPDGHCRNILLVLAAVHGSLGLPGWRLFRGFNSSGPPFPLVPVPNRPSRFRGR